MIGLTAVATSSGAAVKPKATGTLNIAEGAGAAPNYVFPFVGCNYYSVSNINQFQIMMYRPLYFYGKGASVAVQPALSLANAPVWNKTDTSLIINMKGWKFSDGSTINAESVKLFLNMWAADPNSICASSIGHGIPYQVKSVATPKGITGNELQINFKSAINPQWFGLNELSAITPMPGAWDINHNGGAPFSGGCAAGAFNAASTNVKCANVAGGPTKNTGPQAGSVEYYDETTAGAADPTKWTDAFWSHYSGPWALSSADGLGNVSFVPNNQYSGPQKAGVATVNLLAYTQTSAEESDLEGGNLSLGYVDPTTLPGPAPHPGSVGPNISGLVGRYSLQTGSQWGFNYDAISYSPKNPDRAIVNQLYIREALQGMINQAKIAQSVDLNYARVTCSPLPGTAPVAFGHQVACAYPFSKGKAFYEGLLTKHGWKMSGGVMVCKKPGSKANECGPGIKTNRQLTLHVDWVTGFPSLDNTFFAQISEWKAIGFKVSYTNTRSFDQVIYQDCSTGAFDICSWGGGWDYSPDLYPSGEWAFVPGAVFNVEDYNNPHMTALVNQTVNTKVNLDAFDKYAASTLPVLYEPTTYATAEVSAHVHGALAPNPIGMLMPEYITCSGTCNP